MATEKPTPTVPGEQTGSTAGAHGSAAVENTMENITATEALADDTAEVADGAGVIVTGDIGDDAAVADTVAEYRDKANGEGETPGEAAGVVTGDDIVEPEEVTVGDTEAAGTAPEPIGPESDTRPATEQGTEIIPLAAETQAASDDAAGGESPETNTVAALAETPAQGDPEAGGIPDAKTAVKETHEAVEISESEKMAGPITATEAAESSAPEGVIPTGPEATAEPVTESGPEMEGDTEAVDKNESEQAAETIIPAEVKTAGQIPEDRTEPESTGPEPIAEPMPESGPAIEDAMEPVAQPETAAVKTPVAKETSRAEAPAKAAGEPETEKVDFSDEEAELDRLAAEKPEFDLGEEQESELAHEGASGVVTFDPAGKSRAQLLDIFAVLLAEKPVQTIRREVEAIKVAFYKLLRAEHDELRQKYMEAGGEPEDFAPPTDNGEERLKDLFAEYRRRRDEFIARLDRNKEDNLQVKLKVIEDLKELVNSSETLGNTFNTFRELQRRWRDAGPVPQANVKDLWDTYNHHVENFYSYIKINKELRDLDLRKNYEAKLALCEEAEALLLEPSVINSFHRLQKLHEQWREIGPVSNEYKESLWDRFREASSRINKQHQEYFDRQKDEQKRNLDLKTELCKRTEELAAGVWTTRKEWNKASDQLLEIQKVWKTIGFAPKRDNARIYERFRNACDRFFEQKRVFYQQIKVEMEHNLQLKNELCEAAEAIKDSDEWKKTTDELIALQKKWKEVGPVARRHSDAVWKRFRAACDHFFGCKSQHFASKDAEQDENLRLKRELLEEIAAADIGSGGFEMIKEFQRRWSEIGFVPIKQKDSVQKQYKAVMDQAFSTLRGSGQTVRMDRFKDKVRNMKTSGDKRLRFERDRLYNKVKQLESEIALLENNIGFFANSKNAESMIRDVKEKIERTREEMTATIEKINLIDSEE